MATVDNPNVTRIPVRLGAGETPQITEADVTLYDGDIIFIESRETEVFYTGGLLGGGQFTLPRDLDLTLTQAISIAQAQGVSAASGRAIGGVSALNSDVTISPSHVVVLRTLPERPPLPHRGGPLPGAAPSGGGSVDPAGRHDHPAVYASLRRWAHSSSDTCSKERSSGWRLHSSRPAVQSSGDRSRKSAPKRPRLRFSAAEGRFARSAAGGAEPAGRRLRPLQPRTRESRSHKGAAVLNTGRWTSLERGRFARGSLCYPSREVRRGLVLRTTGHALRRPRRTGQTFQRIGNT